MRARRRRIVQQGGGALGQRSGERVAAPGRASPRSRSPRPPQPQPLRLRRSSPLAARCHGLQNRHRYPAFEDRSDQEDVELRSTEPTSVQTTGEAHHAGQPDSAASASRRPRSGPSPTITTSISGWVRRRTAATSSMRSRSFTATKRATVPIRGSSAVPCVHSRAAPPARTHSVSRPERTMRRRPAG